MSSKDEINTVVISALDQCLAMQAEHLAALKTGCLTKVNQWLEDRQLIVDHLRQTLLEAQSSGVSPEFRDILLEKLGCILEREKNLSEVSMQQRSSLNEKLSTLRRGKKALNNYSPALTPFPHFVSHNQ